MQSYKDSTKSSMCFLFTFPHDCILHNYNIVSIPEKWHWYIMYIKFCVIWSPVDACNHQANQCTNRLSLLKLLSLQQPLVLLLYNYPPPFPPFLTPGHHSSVLHLYNFVISIVLYKWNHALCDFLILALFPFSLMPLRSIQAAVCISGSLFFIAKVYSIFQLQFLMIFFSVWNNKSLKEQHMMKCMFWKE